MKLHLTGTLLLAWVIGMMPLAATAQETATQLKGPKSSTSQFSGLEYGPIDAQDTLWRIAERYRQNNNLTIYQVMVAIYELNPEAFEDNNLNLLVDGAMLQLPSERYVARIDAEKARARAEQDDRSLASQPDAPGNSLKNLKPSVPLVNQQDLSQTKTDIEQKISRLDEEQARQFDELRQQFAMSLENVQAILNENRKLYERVERVNDDLQTLKGQVEGDVKSQIDTQVALQQELLDMIKQEQAQRQSEKENGFTDALTSPMALIIGSGLLTLALLGGLAAWLLSRKTPAQADVTPKQEAAPEPAPLNDDIDDLTTELSSDFEEKGELNDDDLFNDDDLLDDVLSSELEEALDDELENFAELDDDMLVPDDDDDAFESGSSELDQDELDSLFDEDDLSDKAVTPDADEDFEGIDLSSDEDDDLESYSQTEQADDFDANADAPDDVTAAVSEDDTDEQPEALEEVDEFEAKLTEDSVAEEDSLAMTQDSESEAESSALQKPDVDDQDDKPEISIDELLEEDEQKQTGTTLSEETEINEGTLDKLDEEINQKNQEIDRLADNIIGEIEQLEMMGGMSIDDNDDDDNDDGTLVADPEKPSSQSIQDLDAVAGDLEDVELDDVDTSEDFSDPLSDDLIAELQAEDEAAEEAETDISAQDALADELLAELGVDDVPASEQTPDEHDSELEDPLTDELLTELEADTDSDAQRAPDNDYREQDIGAGEEHHDPLTDELLNELEASTADDEDHEISVDETDTNSDAGAATDDATDEALTDELLNTLAGDDSTEEALSEQTTQAESSSANAMQDDSLSDELSEESEPEQLGHAPEQSEKEADNAEDSDAIAPHDDAAPDAEDSDSGVTEVDDQAPDDAPEELALDPRTDDHTDTQALAESGTPEVSPGDADDATFVAEEYTTDPGEQAGPADQEPLPESEPDPAPDAGNDEANADDDQRESLKNALDDALDDFDRQMLDDLPSMADSDYTPKEKAGDDSDADDFDDTILDDAFSDVESFELEQEQDGVAPPPKRGEQEINELEDVPGLDDWLSDNDHEPEAEIFDELENSEFDDLLSSIESERDEAQNKPTLDNPDLDLDALLNEDAPSSERSASRSAKEEDFLDVEALMDDSLDEDNSDLDDTPLNLDVSLSEFSGIGDDDDVIDIDKDAGQNANLDLARAYIEMDDTDSARELLDEVLAKGDESQKQEAKAILSSIS